MSFSYLILLNSEVVVSKYPVGSILNFYFLKSHEYFLILKPSSVINAIMKKGAYSLADLNMRGMGATLMGAPIYETNVVGSKNGHT